MGEPSDLNRARHFWDNPKVKGARGRSVLLGMIPLAPAPPLTALPVSPTAKPRIRVNGLQDTDSPLHVTAKTGKEVTLDCEAQGSPPPLVTWTKDAQPLLPGTDRYLKPRASGRGRFAGFGPSWGHFAHPGRFTSFYPDLQASAETPEEVWEPR